MRSELNRSRPIIKAVRTRAEDSVKDALARKQGQTGPEETKTLTLSTIYGIIIKMYWDEHPPPHSHANYGKFEAQVSIETLEIVDGKLPRGATVSARE